MQSDLQIASDEDDMLMKLKDPTEHTSEASSSYADDTDHDADESEQDDHTLEYPHSSTTLSSSTSSPALLSPIHRMILENLRASRLLRPVHVEVKNESYWYYSRKQLRARNHMALVVKHNSNNFRWESYAYKMKPRDEDLEIVPQLQFLTSHGSKWTAMKHSEAFCKQRDMNPADLPANAAFIEPDKLMQTHFRVLVVSELFYHMSNFDRLVLVYEELLSILGQSSDPTEAASLATCPPRTLKLASVFGSSMCSLALLRILVTRFPLTLIISTKTPSQWQRHRFSAPVGERLGSSGVGLTSVSVAPAASPPASKKRITQLTSSTNPRSTGGHRSKELLFPPIKQAAAAASSSSASVSQSGSQSVSLSQGLSQSLGDSLGVLAGVSGVKYKRSGGVYGHFFSDLSPGVRGLILEKTKENKSMIQRESFMKQVYSGQGGGGKGKKGKGVTRASVSSGDYDRGTGSEAEMVEEMQIRSKVEDRAAVRIQRIRRICVLRRVIRTVWMRKWAVLTIQRVVRGRFGRKLSKLLQALVPLAVVRIQQCFRRYKARNIINSWVWACLRMSRVILPRIKSFIVKCVRRWLQRRHPLATRIQAMVRMHHCRVRYFEMVGARYFSFLAEQAAINIQRIVRGVAGRAFYKALIECEMVARIDHPAANKIQRIFRGRKGRFLAVFRRIYLKATLMLQKLIRRYVHRQWYAKMRLERLRNEAAVRIQRVYRGKLDRELARRYNVIRQYFDHYIPAVIRVQTQIRTCLARKAYVKMVSRNRAAVVLQRHYRAYRHRLVVLAQWREIFVRVKHKAAETIQKIVRGRLALLKFRRMVLVQQGRVVLAAKVIMRAWVNFKYAKRMQFLLDANRVDLYTKKVARLSQARALAEVDIEEIKLDIEYAKSCVTKAKAQIQTNEKFICEVNLRLPRIKVELSDLAPEDVERGWPEALRHEFEGLSHQAVMAKEENRVRKARALAAEKEVQRLLFELEETYIELDHLIGLEVHAFEALRRAEVGLIERKVNDKHNRLIRMEKSRWKVESTRLNVMARKQEGQFKTMKQGLGLRDMAFAQTLSYENRARVVDEEEMRFEHLKKVSRKLPQEKQYTQYATPVQKTFDAVLANSMHLLRQFTLDERVHRIKESHLKKEALGKKQTMGQFTILKSDSELRAMHMTPGPA